MWGGELMMTFGQRVRKAWKNVNEIKLKKDKKLKWDLCRTVALAVVLVSGTNEDAVLVAWRTIENKIYIHMTLIYTWE